LIVGTREGLEPVEQALCCDLCVVRGHGIAVTAESVRISER